MGKNSMSICRGHRAGSGPAGRFGAWSREYRKLLLPGPQACCRYEFKLVDVFKLDVSKMKSFDDYLAKLSKKGRWNCKDRQKK